MKSRTLLNGAAMLFAALTIAALPSAWGQTFTTIDPPGSLGASAASINPAGVIVGGYFDATTTHGFLRTNDGIITPFDAPGAAFGTFPSVITPQGLIVGTYFDMNFAMQIFLRAKDGTFTTLQPPSPGSFFTGQVAANFEGAIAGSISDSNGNPSGFLRSPSGNFTVFQFPAAFLTFFFVPNITAINAGGTILGSYFDSNGAIHGFLRTIDGNFTTFDAPNAAFSFFEGTSPTSINNSGTVTGFYFDTSTQNKNLRVFIRARNGTFSVFDTPQLGFTGGSASINSSGAVAGFVPGFVCDNSCTDVFISFLRSATGKISTVSDPVAPQQTGVTAINQAGVMIGFYLDENFRAHAFVRTP